MHHEFDEYSNFRAFGIGRLSEKQKKNREDFNKKVSHIKDEIKKGGKALDSKLGGGKAVHAVNKANPAFLTMRGAMLSIINLNLVGIATALSEMKEDSDGAEDWKKILQKWWMWGGDKSKFEKAVNKGKNKKPAFKALVEKGKKGSNFNGGYYDADGKGLDKAGNSIIIASSLLGIATPILASFTVTAPVAVWTGSAGGGFGAMGGMFKSYAKKKGVDEKKLNTVPITPDLPNAPIPTDESSLEKIAKIVATMDDNGNVDKKLMSELGIKPDKEFEEKEITDKILGMPKPVFWIGVGVIAIVGGYFVYKKFIKK